MRYLKLYAHFIQFSISQSLQFRFDFLFRFLMDIVFYVVSIYFYKVLFTHMDDVAGWTEPQVMIFIGGFFIQDAINMTFFSNNAWMIPSYVNKGELDYYLLRPISSLFFLSCREFSFTSFFNLIIACGFTIYSFINYPDPLYWGRILLFSILILNGTLLFHLVRVIMILPVFWTHNGRGLESIYWAIEKFQERPDRIYTGWVRKILLSILPFILMASFPARVLFEESIWKIALACFGASFIFLFLTKFLWNWALKNYSSASS